VAARRAAGSQDGTFSGVALTHPDRVLDPESGHTKADLARYYETVAERMLPHVAGRPLMLVRCPEGLAGPCFFQKHPSQAVAPPLRGVRIRERKGPSTYLVADDPAGVLALVQMAALEIHVWGARADRIERPDRIVFDLDPGPGVARAFVMTAALAVRRRLEPLGLESFVKTTGGKGVHVVVPIDRRSDWANVRAFASAIGESFVREQPTQFTTELSKARRPGKLLIDTLRNVRGATWVAPYSSRARPGLPVSMPVDWKDLESLAPDAVTLANVSGWLRRADPWRAMSTVRQTITATMLRSLAPAGSPRR
jgi:bifunctional non-homologous end joining protein LigD